MTADIVAIANLGPFDHAFANPPYHPASSTPSPSTPRAGAKIAAPGLLAAWIGAMSRAVRVRGSLSLIVPAGVVPECLAAIASTGCGSCCLMPLWPRAGRPAKLVILQAVRGGRGAFQLAPGMVLHEGAGFSAAAEGILRDAEPLRLRGAG